MTTYDPYTWWWEHITRYVSGVSPDVLEDGPMHYADGAAVAFGLMGMAEAIWKTHRWGIEACEKCKRYPHMGKVYFWTRPEGEPPWLCQHCMDERNGTNYGSARAE